MRIAGIIFDFNGVLINDESLHYHGFKEALKEQGVSFDWKEYQEKYLPYDDENFFLNFSRDRGVVWKSAFIAALIDEKRRHYMEAVEKEMPIIDSSVEFVRRLPADFPLAIASGADRPEIEFVLQRLGLAGRFTALVAAGDVQNGKPDPEAFFKALNALTAAFPHLDRRNVIVIEDSYRGVESVHTAGMKCIALTTNYPRERLRAADLILDDLAGWTLEKLEAALR